MIFFAAVDDLNTNETCAGMTSTLEFNSATLLSFAALNLDMLANDEHLGDITVENGVQIRSVETRKKIVKMFIRSTIQAMPIAHSTTINGNTLPVYVLGIVREKGHPIQLVNAFENPISSKQGYSLESIKRMITEYADLKNTWGIQALFAKAVIKESLKGSINSSENCIENCNLNELVDGMVEYVI